MKVGQLEKKLIFLHIPKTAGSTFHDILARNTAPEKTYTLDGLQPEASVAEFKELTAAGRSSYDLVKGHMLFGLHRHVPEPCTYITFLREPVERVVSYYYYVRRFQDHYLHRQVADSRMTLQQFVDSGLTTEVCDFQVKLLAGSEPALHSKQYDESLLTMARSNIENYFSAVGLVEYFDQSLLLMKQRLAWQFTPYYERMNVTANRAKIDTIDENIIKFIRNRNVLDCALYDWALSRFRRDLDLEKISQGKVALFRMMNRLKSMVRKYAK